jgi:hypothetical protein
MTARRLRWTAFAIALAVQVAHIVVHGTLSDWCFCAITDQGPPPDPPTFVLRFLQFVRFPAVWVMREMRGFVDFGGWGVQAFFGAGLICWFAALLALLHGMALAARLRVGGDGRGAHVRLVPLARVRASQMLLLTCVLLGAGMAYGAAERRRWISEAEQVFAATMAAASTGRPLPPRVGFSMVERRGREDVYVNPGPRFAVDVDPHVAGDHVLDQFVVPYEYGGWVRFPSGPRHEFTVWRERLTGGWSVALYDENLFRPERRRSSR